MGTGVVPLPPSPWGYTPKIPHTVVHLRITQKFTFFPRVNKKWFLPGTYFYFPSRHCEKIFSQNFHLFYGYGILFRSRNCQKIFSQNFFKNPRPYLSSKESYMTIKIQTTNANSIGLIVSQHKSFFNLSFDIPVIFKVINYFFNTVKLI